MACLYTVHRCRSLKSDERIGALHYSDDGEATLCGKELDENWYILDNSFSGKATCRKCVHIDKKTIIPQRANKQHKNNSKG